MNILYNFFCHSLLKAKKNDYKPETTDLKTKIQIEENLTYAIDLR